MSGLSQGEEGERGKEKRKTRGGNRSKGASEPRFEIRWVKGEWGCSLARFKELSSAGMHSRDGHWPADVKLQTALVDRAA